MSLTTHGKTKQEVEENQLLVDSIMFRIIQIAENNGKLSDGFKAKHNNIPWMAIKGMRNRVVHDYGYVDLSFVYDTAINGMPQMYEKLLNLQKEIGNQNV